MATIAEVELMNRGFDRMADTLLRKRMLEEQAKERAMNRDQAQADRTESARRFDVTRADTQEYRSGQLQLDADRLTALQQQTQLGEKLKRSAALSKDLHSSLAMFGELARSGQYSNEELNGFFLQSLDEAGPELKQQLLQNPQFKAVAAGKVDWKTVKAPKEAGEFNTAATRNLDKRLELEMALAQAQTPEEKLMAERALELWKEERGGSGGDNAYQTETEEPIFDRMNRPVIDPETGKQKTSKKITRRVPLQPQNTTPTAPEEVLPLPKSQSELVKGRKYQTSRGAATWDGTKFVK